MNHETLFFAVVCLFVGVSSLVMAYQARQKGEISGFGDDPCRVNRRKEPGEFVALVALYVLVGLVMTVVAICYFWRSFAP